MIGNDLLIKGSDYQRIREEVFSDVSRHSSLCGVLIGVPAIERRRRRLFMMQVSVYNRKDQLWRKRLREKGHEKSWISLLFFVIDEQITISNDYHEIQIVPSTGVTLD